MTRSTRLSGQTVLATLIDTVLRVRESKLQPSGVLGLTMRKPLHSHAEHRHNVAKLTAPGRILECWES